MRNRWLLVAGVMLGIWLVRHHQQSAPPPVPAASTPEEVAPTPQVEESPPSEAKASEPLIAPPAPQSQVQKVEPAPPPPKKTAPPPPNPRALRNTGLPKPASAKEMLSSRTPFRPTTFPAGSGRQGAIDGDVTGYFAGYVYYADNTVHRLRLQRQWGDIKLAMEDNPGDIKQWSQTQHTLRVENFKGDIYSLILGLPDGRVVYLKFIPEASLPGYKDPLTAWQGWLLSEPSPTASVARVGLIDVRAHNREFPPGREGAEEWPKSDAVKSVTAPLASEMVPEGTGPLEYGK